MKRALCAAVIAAVTLIAASPASAAPASGRLRERQSPRPYASAASSSSSSCNFYASQPPPGPCPAAGFSGFPPHRVTYHNGPIQRHPIVYLLLTGHWNYQSQQLQALLGLYQNLPRSTWGHALSAYGVQSIRYGGAILYPNIGIALGPPQSDRFKDDEALVLRAARAFGVKDYADAQFVLAPAPGSNVSTFTNECGEHDYGTTTSGTHFYFEFVLPPLFTPKSTCTYDYDWPAAYNQDGSIAALESLSLHEFAEMATDPLWPTGYSNNKTSYGTLEVADLCYTYSSQWPDLGNATWLWSPWQQACYPTAR